METEEPPWWPRALEMGCEGGCQECLQPGRSTGPGGSRRGVATGQEGCHRGARRDLEGTTSEDQEGRCWMGPEGSRKDVPGDPGGMASWGQGGPERTRNSWRSRRDIIVGTGRSRRDTPGDAGGTSPWGQEGRGATLLEDEEGRGYGTRRDAVPGGAVRDQEGRSRGCVAPGGGRQQAGAPEDTAAPGKRQRGDGKVAGGDVPARTRLRGFDEVASLLYRPSGRC